MIYLITYYVLIVALIALSFELGREHQAKTDEIIQGKKDNK